MPWERSVATVGARVNRRPAQEQDSDAAALGTTARMLRCSGRHVGFLLRSSEPRPVARRRGMSNQNAQTDYYMGLVGGVDTALLRLLPHVDAATLRGHVGPLLKFRADALAKAGADPTCGPKLTRALVTACERTGIAPADIGV